MFVTFFEPSFFDSLIISDSLKNVSKSVLIYDTIIEWIKTELGRRVRGGEYDEEVVKKKEKKEDRVLISKDGGLKILFI